MELTQAGTDNLKNLIENLIGVKNFKNMGTYK